MEIEFARTFLAVAETGSFLKAAERVHITQSTVSSRIKVLEDSLGLTLFDRKKTGVALTPAGLQFVRHAQSLVRTWERARLEVGLPPGLEARFRVGGQYSLWDGYLLHWLPWMRSKKPNLALTAQIGNSLQLSERLSQGTLDFAVMYQPHERPGFAVELLFVEQLVLVSNEASPSTVLSDSYILVNWGDEFQNDHRLNYPDFTSPGLEFDLGTLAVDYLLANTGSGYFPERVVRTLIDKGDLSLVEKAPVFRYPTYAVYPRESDAELIELAMSGLKELADRTLGALT